MKSKKKEAKETVFFRSKNTTGLLKLASQYGLDEKKARAEIKLGRQKNAKMARNLRLKVARIKTILRERKLEEEK